MARTSGPPACRPARPQFCGFGLPAKILALVADLLDPPGTDEAPRLAGDPASLVQAARRMLDSLAAIVESHPRLFAETWADDNLLRVRRCCIWGTAGS